MEQGQGFAAKINKRHEEYKSSTLTGRAVVASMQPLVSKSTEERSIERASAKHLRFCQSSLENSLVARFTLTICSTPALRYRSRARESRTTWMCWSSRSIARRGETCLLVSRRSTKRMPNEKGSNEQLSHTVRSPWPGRTWIWRSPGCALSFAMVGFFRVRACTLSASERVEFNRMYGEKRFGVVTFVCFGRCRWRHHTGCKPIWARCVAVLFCTWAHTSTLVVVESLPQQAGDNGLHIRECCQGGSHAACFWSSLFWHASEHCRFVHIPLARLMLSLTSLSLKATPAHTLLQARCIWRIPGWVAMVRGCHCAWDRRVGVYCDRSRHPRDHFLFVNTFWKNLD